MGRAGAEMIPFLDRGSEGMAEFKQAAEDAGVVLTGPMQEGMDKTAIGFKTFDLAAKGLGISLFEVFKPATDAVVSGLVSLIEAMNDSIRCGGTMADAVKVIAAGLNLIVGSAATVSVFFGNMWRDGVAAYKGIADAMHGDFTKALADVEDGLKKNKI